MHRGWNISYLSESEFRAELLEIRIADNERKGERYLDI